MKKESRNRDPISVALKFLSYRARSVKEVEERLSSRGFEKEAISRAIGYLKGAGYLDDEVFARDLARARARVRNWGSIKIAAELASKGVPSEAIGKAVGEVAPGDGKNALLALEKWVKRNGITRPLDSKKSSRAFRFLKSRGFSTSVSAGAIKNFGEASEGDFL